MEGISRETFDLMRTDAEEPLVAVDQWAEDNKNAALLNAEAIRTKSRHHVIVSSGWWSYQTGRFPERGAAREDDQRIASLITFWSSSSAASLVTLLRSRHGKITPSQEAIPAYPAKNGTCCRSTQQLRDRADNCGKGVAVGVAQRGGGWQALTHRIGGPELGRYEHG